MLGLLLSMAAAYFFLIVLYYVACIVGKWKVFQKMDEPGWASVIPFYNDYIIYKDCWNTTMFFAMLACMVIVALTSNVSGSSDASLSALTAAASSSPLSSLASMVLFVLTFLKNIKLSRSFGHGYLFAFGLLILEPVFFIVLGFGESRYLGNSTEGF